MSPVFLISLEIFYRFEYFEDITPEDEKYLPEVEQILAEG